MWLLEGLAGFLEGQFVRKYMGRNENNYRSLQEAATSHRVHHCRDPVNCPTYAVALSEWELGW